MSENSKCTEYLVENANGENLSTQEACLRVQREKTQNAQDIWLRMQMEKTKA